MTTKSTAAERLRHTAYHEAGHAVASYFLQVPIRDVTIIPDKDSLGVLTHPPIRFVRHPGVFDDSRRGIDRPERHIIVCFAGPLAQRRFAPGSRWRVGAYHDFNAAGELMVRIQDPDPEGARLYGRLLHGRAQVLVKNHWKDIVAVAEALLKHKRLDADGVNAVIERVHGVKPLERERMRQPRQGRSADVICPRFDGRDVGHGQ